MTETQRTEMKCDRCGGFSSTRVCWHCSNMPDSTYIANLQRELAEARKVEIRTDPCGALDEVVSSGAHLEQMTDNSWFLSIGEVNVWLNAKGAITVTYEDNRAIDAARMQERT